MSSLTRSYCHSPRSNTPLLGISLGQQFYLTADKYPDKEMYVFYGDQERKTFKQMKDESQRLAACFLSLGLNTGDRVGIWGGNHYEWPVTYLACMQLGLVMVHMRMDFPLTMQTLLLKKIGCKALVLSRSPSNLYDEVCEIIPELRSCQSDQLDCQSLPDMKFVAIGGEQHRGKSGVYYLDDLIQRQPARSQVDKVIDICNQVDFDAPAVIIFTSGSTGTPKAVTHSNHSLLNFYCEECMYRGNVNDYVQTWDTKYALITHLSGVSAQNGALLPIAKGCTTVMTAPLYDIDPVAKAYHAEKCTDSGMLIHHFNDFLNLPYLKSLDFSNNQIILTAGSPIPRSMREESKNICKMNLMLYGATEVLGILLQHPMDSAERIQSGAYRCIGGVEVKIVNDNGQIVPVNTIGEMYFRGYTTFLYYWGDEEKTKQAKDANGWWRSGDMGVMDSEGFIQVVGRKSDFLIVEGYNVSPFDLEDVLHTHPSIANVMVVGIPNRRSNEAVCVCIRLKTGAQLSKNDVQSFCKNKVSTMLTPRYVLFVDNFPTMPTGKFHRKQMAELALEILNSTS